MSDGMRILDSAVEQ